MTQRRIPAVYMRGGTSRCLVFHERDLPAPGPDRDAVLLAALGSPDPNGRQLDGLGGGISSLSKAVIIGPPTLPGADVDYTFAQIEVKKAFVDYAGNCGNCSSSVGPFAIDEGLVAAREGETLVRIHNTNTKKLIVAHVPVAGGEAAVDGDFELAGVAGLGARIALDFVEPGGAGTGRLLPTGRARDVIDGVEVSCVDATNPVVFVRAADLGLTATETPTAVDADRDLGARLETLRVEAAVRMGMARSAAVPKIAFVAPPAEYTALDGTRHRAGDFDVLGRAISMGNCHRAFPLTVAMCLAVAARIPGSVVQACVASADGDVRLGHPSGVLPIAARVDTSMGEPRAETVTVYRTARRLMEGFVRVP
ncbi:MAG TPA: PrpF domain-containing protein [Methylomirabilota bacterium]|jgi:2-methylaconitate cis-trans-isomerase PrpF|nr:PrpF domain-containing protein [Methylomirabilota bacterium]